MIICKTRIELKKTDRSVSLGFVPTMGALHIGHEALIQESKKNNEKTWVSVFVNPLQFNDKKDFDVYPKKIEADLEICEKLGVDGVFMPSEQEIYLPNESIVLAENIISKSYEGLMRPGHFEGVLSVMLKLLNIMQPQRVYMGLKDYQQWLLIKMLCENFFISTEVVGVETVRDSSGLPYSSRNLNLSKAGLKKAREVAKVFKESQDKKSFLEAVGEIELDYYGPCEGRILMAHRVDSIRILDNKSIG